MPDYSFYTNTYHGSLIPEADFPYLIGKADARLGELTYGRHSDPDLPASVQTRVSLALCAVADVLFSFGAASAGAPAATAVASETVGSHTVKYRDAASAAGALAFRVRGAAADYLLPTGLLNRAALILE